MIKTWMKKKNLIKCQISKMANWWSYCFGDMNNFSMYRSKCHNSLRWLPCWPSWKCDSYELYLGTTRDLGKKFFSGSTRIPLMTDKIRVWANYKYIHYTNDQIILVNQWNIFMGQLVYFSKDNYEIFITKVWTSFIFKLTSYEFYLFQQSSTFLQKKNPGKLPWISS